MFHLALLVLFHPAVQLLLALGEIFDFSLEKPWGASDGEASSLQAIFDASPPTQGRLLQSDSDGEGGEGSEGSEAEAEAEAEAEGEGEGEGEPGGKRRGGGGGLIPVRVPRPMLTLPGAGIVVQIVCALVYYHTVHKRRDPFPQELREMDKLGAEGQWRHDILDCCGESQSTFLYGCCLTGLRLGDTHGTAGVGSYWCTCLLFEITLAVAAGLQGFLTPLVGQSAISRAILNFTYFGASLFMAGFLSSRRQALRRKLGDASPGSHCLNDFLCYWWCACCVACQEGRQVDEIQGVSVTCCFVLHKGEPPPVAQPAAVGMPVGQPVVVGAPMGAANEAHEGKGATA